METQQLTLAELEPGSLIEIPEDLKQAISEYPAYGNNQAIYVGAVQGWDKTPVIHLIPTDNSFTVRPIALNWRGKAFNALMDMRSHVAKLKASKKYPIPLDTLTMSIGSDPEIFATNSAGIIPAWKYLPTKKERTVYWDGFQAEFTTVPRHCLVEYTASLDTQLTHLRAALHKYDADARLIPNSVIDVSLETLANLDKKYVEFGCKPSLNIYDDMGERVDARLLPRRFAGGHVHAGIGLLHKPMVKCIVEALDGLCALPCVGMAASLDDPIRRRFYGRAGEIRLPEHGLEYRVLSNFWLLAPPLEYIVHELFRVAIRFGMTGMYRHLFTVPQTEVRRIVNTCDVEAARKAVRDNEGLFKHLLSYMNIDGADPQHFFTLIYKGAEYVLPSMDINQNWDKKYISEAFARLNNRAQTDITYGGSSWNWQRLSLMLSKGSVRPVMV